MKKIADFFKTSICKIFFPYTVELARRGNYKEAEKALRFILDHDASPEYFLLLGKVYAQQGKYEDAIAEWKRVLEINPENREARAAILRAEDLSKGILPTQFFKWRLIAGVLGLFLVLSLGMSFTLWKGKADIFSQYKDSLQENQALSVKYQELEKNFEEGREDIDAGMRRYQELTGRYEEFERRIGKQLVIALKGGHRLAQIKGLGGSGITIKQKNGHVSVYGEVPTEYLKGLIEKVVKGLKGVESVDLKGLDVIHNYTVSSGDVLSVIAEKVYGDHKKWKDIHKENRDKIKNPNIIYPGDTLDIP